MNDAQLLRYSRQILLPQVVGEVDALGKSVEGVASSVRGHIRLTAPPLLARLLVPVLSEFQAEYPDASLEVEATNMVQDLELLESDPASLSVRDLLEKASPRGQ